MFMLLLIYGPSIASPEDGLVETISNHDVSETTARAATAIESRGFKIVARVDHAAAATSAGLNLVPTQVLIFGNPKGGTPLMHCNPKVAIDLPLKLLVWEDEQGATRIAYNSTDWLNSRHSLENCAQVLQKMSGALSAVAAEAGN
jgi:uncharacterized protein (DUF302 family)